MTQKILCFLFLLLIPGFSAKSQQTSQQYSDTLEFRKGLKAIERYGVEGDSVKTGKYAFETIPNDSACIQKINRVKVDGNYINDKKTGNWSMRSDQLHGQLSEGQGYTALINYNGESVTIRGSFNDNLPHGTWTAETNTIIEGKKQALHQSITMYLEEGTGKGRFEASNSKNGALLNGEFDSEGNLHNYWTFQYKEEQRIIKEIRKYQHGFLLELQKIDRESLDTILSIDYDDVKLQLSLEKSDSKNGGTMVQGEKQFGILFNNGYRVDDEKRTAQNSGNELLGSFLSSFRQENWPHQVLQFDKDFRIAATRRFRYIYEIGEEEALRQMRSSIAETVGRIDTLREDADLRINKVKDDSLAYLYEFSVLLKYRLRSIDSIAVALASEKFHYQFRDNYFKEGIPLTCVHDTIKYNFEGTEKTHVNAPVHCIEGPDSLVYRLHEYVNHQISNYSEVEASINKKLMKSRKSAKIKEYNERIIQLRDSMESVYLGAPIEVLNDKALRHSLENLGEPELDVYETFGVHRLNELLNDYSDEQSPASKIATGDEIITLLEKLINVRGGLANLQAIPEELDKAFKRFSPNPYFPRDIESRIKPHIYSRGVEILFPHYLRLIRREESIDGVEQIIGEIYLMRDRLLEISKMEGEEINRLNSRMRREEQPERIKRLLGL